MALRWFNRYGVYGRPEEDNKDNPDTTGNPYGYTGEAYEISKLNYLRARYTVTRIRVVFLQRIAILAN